jgi:hypothetical protein
LHRLTFVNGHKYKRISKLASIVFLRDTYSKELHYLIQLEFIDLYVTVDAQNVYEKLKRENSSVLPSIVYCMSKILSSGNEDVGKMDMNNAIVSDITQHIQLQQTIFYS